MKFYCFVSKISMSSSESTTGLTNHDLKSLLWLVKNLLCSGGIIISTLLFEDYSEIEFDMKIDESPATSGYLRKGKIDHEIDTRTKISARISDIRTFFTLPLLANNKSHTNSNQSKKKGEKMKHCNCHWLMLLLFIKIIPKFCKSFYCFLCFSVENKNFPSEKIFAVRQV